MRIIAGEYRRRILHSPRGLTTRPIPDRVKESIFSMLGERVRGAAVVDLFAGSGAIGLEALSRGAASCLFVERDRMAADTLERNIEMLGCGDRCRVVRGDAMGVSILARAPRPADLIFLDPPYPIIKQVPGWERMKQHAGELVKLLADDGFLLLRTPCPHLVEAAEPGAADSPAPRRAGDEEPRFDLRAYERENERRRRRDRGPGRRGGAVDPEDRMDPYADPDASPEENEGATEAELAADEIAPGPGRLPADPAIDGAIGPETHPYGSTAVHLYMRRRPEHGAGGATREA